MVEIIFSLLLLNPSINFGIISAEVFPWAFFIGLIKIKKFEKNILTIIFSIIILSVFHLIFDQKISPDFVRSFSAYINPLLAVLIIFSSKSIRTSIIKISEPYLFFLLILGVLQNFSLITFLDGFFQFFIPRASADNLSFSGRGVSLLSTEPARAGIELIFLYLFVKNFKSTYNLKRDLLFGFYLIIILKSITVFAFYLIMLLLLHLSIKKIPLVATFTLILFLSIVNFYSDARIGMLISSLKGLNYSDAIDFIINTSGNRIASILSFYPFGIGNPFGGGIGNWQLTSIQALEFIGYDYQNLNFFQYSYNEGMRGSGYFTNLMLDLGIVGLLSVLIPLKILTKKISYQTKKASTFKILFFLSLFFIGSVGTTNNWVLFFTLIFNENEKQKNNLSNLLLHK